MYQGLRFFARFYKGVENQCFRAIVLATTLVFFKAVYGAITGSPSCTRLRLHARSETMREWGIGESMAACGGRKRVSGATAGGWYKGLDADKV